MPASTTAPATIRDAAAQEFLLDLVDTPAPSGFEGPAAATWRTYAGEFAEVREDPIGNSFATINAGARARVVLAGHLDEIGLIVTKVEEKGYLRCTNIGGWDIAVLVGQRVRIVGASGVVYGSIGRPAVHVLEAGARDKVPKLKDLWIDIGADSAEEARKLVAVGDPIVIDAEPRLLGDHRIVSRSLDNRLGAFVAVEALRALAGSAPEVEVTAIGTTSEEIGGTGALTASYGLQPDAAIAIDVTTPGDTPGGSDIGDLHVGKGPIITRGATTNVRVVDGLIAAAEAEGIPYQLRGMGARTRTDADAMARAGSGVPVGLLSIPARYLHSPCEHADLRDVQATVDLIAAWVRRMEG